MPAIRGVVALPRHAFVLLLPVLCACAPAMAGKRGVPNPRRAYVTTLDAFGAEGPSLAHEWSAAGERALLRPATIAATFEETLFFAAHPPRAVGYRIELRRGESLRVRVEPSSAGDVVVFLELFELVDGARPRLVARAAAGSRSLRYLARRPGAYVLRVQPAALHGGLFRVLIGDVPGNAPRAAFTFPVAGRDTRAIRSWFGDPRDGGRRDHHGVDIFAARGTPALAAASGVIRRVRHTRLGGNVIWLECDGSDLWLYYAHLDEQLVRPGTRVRRGDRIGLVGNTGNARATSPHLHFGVYRNRDVPLDPMAFLRAGTVRPVLASTEPSEVLGTWTRAAAAGAMLRASPAARAPVVATLEQPVPLRVIGASDGWYRVATADDRHGFIPVERVWAQAGLLTPEN